MLLSTEGLPVAPYSYALSFQQDKAVAGTEIELKYMPTSLILRAVGAPWALRSEALPDLSRLPELVCRRGLFQLEPSTMYLPKVLGKDVKIKVRRIQFPVVPADVRTVYGAQGENWDAIIADMERPPNMVVGTHWLACYVMISRARTLEGLLILRPATFAELNRGAPEYLVKEIDRLLRMEQTSTDDLRKYLEKLTCIVPKEVLDLFTVDAVSEEETRIQRVRSAAMTDTAPSTPTSAVKCNILPDGAVQGRGGSRPVGVDQESPSQTSQPDLGSRLLGVAMRSATSKHPEKRGSAIDSAVDGMARQADARGCIDGTPESPSKRLRGKQPHIVKCAAARSADIASSAAVPSLADSMAVQAGDVLCDVAAQGRGGRHPTRVEQEGLPQPTAMCSKKRSLDTDSAANVSGLSDSMVGQAEVDGRVGENIGSPSKRRRGKQLDSARCNADCLRSDVPAGGAAERHERSSPTDSALSGVDGASSLTQRQHTQTQGTSPSKAAASSSVEVQPAAQLAATPPLIAAPELPVCEPVKCTELLDARTLDAPGILGYPAQGETYVDPVRASLRNPGNMCYLNALLHVLARTPRIRNWAVQHLALYGQRPGHLPCVLCDLGADLRCYSLHSIE